GPFNGGTAVFVTAVGVDLDICQVTATATVNICAPDNNDCIDAIALSCGDSIAGSTMGATQSGIPTPSCANGTPADVFYTLDVVEGTEYIVSINGADYDGVLVIYSGTCESLTQLECSDSGFSAGVAETITFTALNTETLLIRTYDWSDTKGSFIISVTCEDIVEFDCPALEANIGDACDDENADTENDTINEDCECVGTPIVVFDCPALEANIGDACDDENADTENDSIN